MSDDYYALLEVSRTADDGTIKSSYRKLAMRYHPDKNPGCAESEAKFKAINDALGHAAGDQLLQELGQRLRRTVRAGDEVCRHSGDEFLVLMRQVGDWDEVAALELDPERVTALLYGGQDPHDREALRQLDSAWCSRPELTRRGWFRRLRSGGGRRSVPPAALRAHPSAR